MIVDPSGAPDPPLGFPDPPRSRFEFWVRFLFGALLGIVLGMAVWLRFFLRAESGWIAVPVVTLLCAFSAGRYGDNFWVSLRGLRRLRWWD
jgi:hypothetical protein